MHRRYTASTTTLLTGTVPASNLQTLILANYGRMTDDGQLTALQQKVTSFAAAVGGAVVNVNQATSPRVAALDSQADANTGCAYAKNLVANAIRDIVTRYRTANPNLKYIVIVGDDHAIPFFRYPDTAGIGPESDFSPPVLDTSASQASLQTNDVLSQDAYGSTNVREAQVGVEQPDDLGRRLDRACRPAGPGPAGRRPSSAGRWSSRRRPARARRSSAGSPARREVSRTGGEKSDSGPIPAVSG